VVGNDHIWCFFPNKVFSVIKRDRTNLKIVLDVVFYEDLNAKEIVSIRQRYNNFLDCDLTTLTFVRSMSNSASGIFVSLSRGMPSFIIIG